MSEKIRVIIADDHPIVRSGLRLMLGMEERIELVGEAADGSAALPSRANLHRSNPLAVADAGRITHWLSVAIDGIQCGPHDSDGRIVRPHLWFRIRARLADSARCSSQSRA